MNRLTTAFSSAIPSASGDSQSSASVSTSPVDGSFDRPRSPYGYNERSASAHLSLPPQIYDDPRATHFGPAPDRLFIPSRFGDRRDSSGSRPRRPELLRHVSDGAGGRSGGATPRPRGQSGSRDRERDRGVRANLGQGKRKERIGAMCKGPEDRFAVGGPQYLKILHVARPSSGGTTTPSVQPQTGRAGSPRGRHQAQPLARGPGGASITEVANLWKGSWAVSKGVNDIDWGSGSYDRKIATATPSGNFMLFDLVKNKLERDVSGGHPRPMNCIRLCQTPSYGHLLLTGSTEGVAKLWDMREGEPISKKYYKHSAAVTSLAFSPVDPHHFAVGTENGVIKRYDMRMAPRPIGSVWGAHGNKPVMDLKWRAGWEGESLDGGGTGGWMASAGADRTVQTWDRPPIPIHTLHTSQAVRRVSWRPSRSTELAVVPLFQPAGAGSDAEGDLSGDDDGHIEIWDVRRHYIAKYALPSLEGAAVDVAWGDDPLSLVTAFQNGVLSQLDTRDRTIPLEGVPRQVVAWSPYGEVVYGLDRFKAGEIPFDDLKPEYANHWDKVGQRPKAVSDPRYDPLQAVGFTQIPHSDPDEFIYLAQQYRIEGDSPEDLCRWNAEIAEVCGRRDDARIWGFLRALIEEFAPPPPVTPKAGSRTFDEEIFSHPLPSAPDRAPSPVSTSPRGGSFELPSPGQRSQALSSSYSSRGEAIRLDRLDDGEGEDTERIEELLDSPTPAAFRSNKVISFAPPGNEVRRLSEARTSVSTVVPGRSSTATVVPLTVSRPATSTSTPVRVKSPEPAPSRHKKRAAHTSASSTYSDYPDPYGISAPAPSSTSQSTSSKMTTREPSPARDTGVIQLSTSRSRRDSRDKSTGGTRHNSGDKSGAGTEVESRRRSKDEEARRKSSGSIKPDTTSTPIKRDFAAKRPAVVAVRTKAKAGKDDKADKEMEVYKAERCRPLMTWWEASLDEGDVQLAATLLIVGTSTMTFPPKRSERVVHSYIDMLDRAHLPLQSAYIRKYAQILSLEVYAQDSGITHIAHCQRCRKSTGSLEDIGVKGKRFWWCRRCRLAARICVICRQGVKGLWMSCGRCGHGGHHKCMRMYYLSSPLEVAPVPLAQGTSQAGSSGLQRTSSMPFAGTGTSHDSSGFIAGRSSGETSRDQPQADTEYGLSRAVTRDTGENVANGGTVKGWNTCPGGCGCKCRAVVAMKDEGGLRDLAGEAKNRALISS